MPYSSSSATSGSLALSDFPIYFDLIRSVLSKYPDYHYHAKIAPQFDSTNGLFVGGQVIIVLFKDYSNLVISDSGGITFDMGMNSIHYTLFENPKNIYLPYYWQYQVFTPGYLYYAGVEEIEFSDLGPLPDIRENREEVTYLHAQTVILASFVLFALFRRLWLSIRGRVD